MSLITIHYGQCGNQIGEVLFSKVYVDLQSHKKDPDYLNEAAHKWFNITKNDKWEPRSILVDTERKTLNMTRKNYSFKNVVTRSSGGAANNWACGYYEHGKLICDDILNYVRLEIEKSDSIDCLLNIFSSSGGTGSGVGTFMTEKLRNEFGSHNKIVNAIIIPYMDGEVVIQSYNTLLTLSKIYDIGDANIIFENDRLHYNCVNSLNIKNVTFCDINSLISSQLSTVFYPLDNVKSSTILSNLCLGPVYKFLQVRSAPLSPDYTNNCSVMSLKYLLNTLSRQYRFDFQQLSRLKTNLVLKQSKSLASVLISRGKDTPSDLDLRPFKDCFLSSTSQFSVQRTSEKLFNLDNCLCVVSNANNICVPLNKILDDAWNLFRFRAYLHHYEKFGVDQFHFRHSFKELQKVLKGYKKL